MSVVPFAYPDGGAVFTCTGCGYVIIAAVTDGFPTCSVCRWLDERPQIPAEVRDRIRGVTRDSGENGCGNG
jgi:hypothetical protein